jgi:hypothetical protein
LRFVPAAQAERNGTTTSHAMPTAPGIDSLLKTLGSPGLPPTTVIWHLQGGGWLEFRKGATSKDAVSTAVTGQDRRWSEVKQAGAGMENKR